MKRKFIITGLVAILLAGVVGNRMRLNRTTARYTIGILQTASHPALDAVREGFVHELQQKLGDHVAFFIHNAQGSIAQAHAVAQQLHADTNVKAVFAIATPAAQAMSAVEKEKPIIIAAVTDPHALGLIHPTTNVCGTTDMIDVAAEVDMLTKWIPQAKTVGLLFTSGETNSLVLIKHMHEEAEKRGITAIDFAVASEADMPAVVELACRKVDVLLAPTDNTVASCITLIAAVAEKHAKPLIVSDNMLVASGALAARGVDYRAAGIRAAQIAEQVLVENKKPFELPIEHPDCNEIFVNKAMLEKLKLEIPASLQSAVTFTQKGE